MAVPDASTWPVRDDFHETHKHRYGHSNPAAPVEFVNLRVAAFGVVGQFSVKRPAPEQRGRPHLANAPMFNGRTSRRRCWHATGWHQGLFAGPPLFRRAERDHGGAARLDYDRT